MQITKRNLKFLIESLLNEEDPRFSAARDKMEKDRQMKSDLEAARELRLSVHQEAAINELVEEELNITAQWFNTVVFPALENDPENMNIVIDYPYLIADSKILEDANLSNHPILGAIAKYGRMHFAGARYVGTLKVGSKIESMDSKVKINYINFNKYADQPMSWWDKLSAMRGANLNMMENLINDHGSGLILNISNIYEGFEIIVDSSGMDVMTTFKGVKGGGLF